MSNKGFTTRSLNVPYLKTDAHKALQMPLYESVAFEFDSAEQIAASFRGEYLAHVYSRSSSPTVEYFELKMKELTRSHAVLALSSGMAAISNALFTIVKAGDNIISGQNLFGHTYSLFKQTFSDLGIEVRFSDLTNQKKIEQLIDDRTRAIYFETVTNPQLEISDIDMLALTARKHNILLVADSTMTPPNVFRAANYGVNMEVVSTTKYISGGATSFGGAVIDHGNYNWELNPNLNAYTEKFGKNAFMAKLRKNIYRNTGSAMAPQTAKFQIQGLDILELRVEKCYQNCMRLADFLESIPKVKSIIYPGSKNSELYAKALKYFSGIPGTIMTFDLESQEACFAFMNKLQIIRRATNLNDNKSLIIHPYSTIYTEFSDAEKERMGIRSSMLRLSVGIENVEDLMEDINQALIN